MSGHTPGPWVWIEDRFRGGYSGLFDPNDQPVIYPQHANDGDDGAAWFDTCGDAGDETLTADDARLIACAPDLLEALQSILPFIPITSAKEGGASAYSENVRAADKVRAAIAKATGEQA